MKLKHDECGFVYAVIISLGVAAWLIFSPHKGLSAHNHRIAALETAVASQPDSGDRSER